MFNSVTNINLNASVLVESKTSTKEFLPPISCFSDPADLSSLKEKLRFHEMTRRLSPSEFAELTQKLSQVGTEEIKILFQALARGDWQAPIFQKDRYPYMALEAYRRGVISSEQFGTVMLYWVNCRDFGKDQVQAIPLFNKDGSVNEVAESILQQTMRGTDLPPLPHLPSIPATYLHLDFQRLREVIFELKKCLSSEQFIFVRKNDYTPGNIADSLYNNSINIFHRFNKGCMVPSLSLVRCFLEKKYGAGAAKINLVLGSSSMEDIEKNNQTHSRDVALHFPGTTLPDTADGQDAPGYLFTLHDLLFHLFMVSQIPFEHAQRFMGIVEKIKSKDIDLQMVAQYVAFLIDMDFGDYREEILTLKDYRLPHEQRREHVFWSILATYVGHAHQFLKESQLQIEPSMEFPLIETEDERSLLNFIAHSLPRNPQYDQEMRAEIDFIQRFNPQIDIKNTHLFYLHQQWNSHNSF